MWLKKKPLNRSLTSSVGCPHLHRSLIPSVIIQPLLAEIPCSSLCTQINLTKTQAGDTGSKFHTLPPSNIHDTEESNRGFHQIHLTAPDTPAYTFPKQETSAGFALWGGSILNLQRLSSCTVVQRRTSSPALPCCNAHPTGKGQHTHLVLCQTTFCCFFFLFLHQKSGPIPWTSARESPDRPDLA